MIDVYQTLDPNTVYLTDKTGSTIYCRIPLKTGERIETAEFDKLDEDGKWVVRTAAKHIVPGQVFHHKGTDRHIAVGRPDCETEDCFEVDLKAPGNPDLGQFVSVADPCRARGLSKEEIVASCEYYRNAHSLGGGNWTRGCGTVYCIKPGVARRVKVAHVSYNGRWWTAEEYAASVASVSSPKAPKNKTK